MREQRQWRVRAAILAAVTAWAGVALASDQTTTGTAGTAGSNAVSNGVGAGSGTGGGAATVTLSAADPSNDGTAIGGVGGAGGQGANAASSPSLGLR